MWRPPERINGTATGRLAQQRPLTGTGQFDKLKWSCSSSALDPGYNPGGQRAMVLTPQVLDWHGRFARGRPGAIVEATGIRDIPSGPLHEFATTALSTDCGPCETVRRESDGAPDFSFNLSTFSIRRRPDPERFLREFLEITDVHRDTSVPPGKSLSATTLPRWIRRPRRRPYQRNSKACAWDTANG